MIALLLAAAAAPQLPFLAGEPQREIAPYLNCMMRAGISKGIALPDLEERRALAAKARAQCDGARQQAIADVEHTAEITHLPATHVQATALAKSIDRAIERWVEAGPSLAPDAAMQILNEETRSAFNR